MLTMIAFPPYKLFDDIRMAFKYFDSRVVFHGPVQSIHLQCCLAPLRQTQNTPAKW